MEGKRMLKALMSACLLFGAVAMAQEPAKPKPAAVEEVKSPNATGGSEGGAPVDPKSYKLGPEDVVGIRVWREPDLSGQFVVRPDGKITLPLTGDMKVEGISLDQLKDEVTKAYGEKLNRPEVSVSLVRVGSKKYYLVGGVAKTGMFPLVVPLTVLEALNAAGGLREFANKKKIVILRGTQRIKFNYDEVMKGKKLEQNIFVENGDQIFVPE
jgi:polysaccharide biosynthesis/export protein